MSTATAPSIDEAVETIHQARENYEQGMKELKLAYLQEVSAAKETFGTSNLADALGVSRHRVYQMLNEEKRILLEMGQN